MNELEGLIVEWDLWNKRKNAIDAGLHTRQTDETTEQAKWEVFVFSTLFEKKVRLKIEPSGCPLSGKQQFYFKQVLKGLKSKYVNQQLEI